MLREHISGSYTTSIIYTLSAPTPSSSALGPQNSQC